MRKASLRDLRKDRHYRLVDVADIVGITPGSLSRIENGVRQPMLSTFARIAHTLHLTDAEIADLVRSAGAPDGDPGLADEDPHGEGDAHQVAA